MSPLRLKNLKLSKLPNGTPTKAGQSYNLLIGVIPNTTVATHLHSVGLFHENE